jgi:hypothetical protein
MKKNMNMATLVAGIVSVCLLAVAPLRAADGKTRYNASSGSKLRLEGTSTFHDWQCVASLIIGFLEVGPNFPTEPGQAVTPGKVEANGNASIKVRSIRSVKKDGSFDSDKMDDKMYDMLEKSTNAFTNISFSIKELTLKEAPKDKAGAYVFDSKGDLTVGGVTNSVAFPVNIFVLPDNKLKIAGTVPLKMTQFKINPYDIIFAKTGDDVTIKFEWMLKKSGAPAAATASAPK